jgi:lipopolysaccharide transport system permease protein/teichoic acid transport system permease protein
MNQYIKDLIKRKDLLIYLVLSGLKAQHRNSLLGYFWWLLDPLLNVVVYYFLVVIVLGRGGENYGAFLVIGLVSWRWINSVVRSSAKSIIGQSGIISQVYLPKAVFPIGTNLTQLINFSFGLIVVALFLVSFKITPGLEVLWLPLIMVVQLLFLLAVSLILGYICVFIRDIDNILSYVLRFLFYGSPVIWEGSRLPQEYSWVVDINPISAFLTSYRNILMYNSDPEFTKLLLIGLISLMVIIYMIYYYSKNEHKIIKVL